MTGIRQGQNIDYSELSRSYLPLPPLPEQRAIVRYLDHVDDRIRRYISAREKLIALLEEERQAVIHRAVTRGLDPNVPLKPSGVEWLGDVPAHWEVHKDHTIMRNLQEAAAHRLLQIKNTMVGPYLGSQRLNIENRSFIQSKKTLTDRAFADKHFATLSVYPEGSIAVAMYGATIGRLAYSRCASCC